MKPDVKTFFDEETFTASHVVCDQSEGTCAIIDSVLDYDAAAGRTSTSSADAIIDYVRSNDMAVEWILETHVHADHLTAAPYLKEKLGGKSGIGDQVRVIQDTFGKIFNVEAEFSTHGSHFDTLFADGEAFKVGGIEAKFIYTPGHTPACSTIVIGDAAFVGDTLFMPDYGTARCDFPGGDARTLYRSIQRIFALPDETRLFMCHDYKAPGRDTFKWQTTVAEQRSKNIHIHGGVSEDEFVAMRESRDKNLSMPKLILPSVQVNMRGGAMPPPEDNGVSYLKIPINTL
ncbi:MBL fold metallo-hydrolase [Hyphococcus flavus]|uniref:MBL fold metallo-hydrolase n=1 Tax=Hyphococcus flavus TaxID=1866326 RepID=A0AAE9ZBE9_9PROT|nr:MBL fold metallo-hydrolase [Hyphococcus flavus]WDI31519.1 MBL fold metallo-hydrolase [Hyphococcus flavus]